MEDSNTFGLVRAEVLGALVNAVFLMALCFSIFVEALKRLIETDSIKNPDLVLIVGAAGLFINLVGLFLFQGKEIYDNSTIPLVNARNDNVTLETLPILLFLILQSYT